MLPGACIIHFPKCKTVVLDCEVLGGRNGMERWCLSILLSSKVKKTHNPDSDEQYDDKDKRKGQDSVLMYVL